MLCYLKYMDKSNIFTKKGLNSKPDKYCAVRVRLMDNKTAILWQQVHVIRVF